MLLLAKSSSCSDRFSIIGRITGTVNDYRQFPLQHVENFKKLSERVGFGGLTAPFLHFTGTSHRMLVPTQTLLC